MDEPQRGEVWKWGWLWVTITKVGPKVIEVESHERNERWRIPRERFFNRFHRTGL